MENAKTAVNRLIDLLRCCSFKTLLECSSFTFWMPSLVKNCMSCKKTRNSCFSSSTPVRYIVNMVHCFPESQTFFFFSNELVVAGAVAKENITVLKALALNPASHGAKAFEPASTNHVSWMHTSAAIASPTPLAHAQYRWWEPIFRLIHCIQPTENILPSWNIHHIMKKMFVGRGADL